MMLENSRRRHESEIHVWFTSLLAAWNEAWQVAPSLVRAQVEGSLCYLEAPVQGHLYLSRSTAPMTEAAILILIRDPKSRHGELRMLQREDASDWWGDAPDWDWAKERVAAWQENMVANWTEGREASQPSSLDLGMWRMDTDVPRTGWMISGDLLAVDFSKLIEGFFRLRPELHEANHRQPDTTTPISSLKVTREPAGLARWLEIFAPSLLAALEIQGPSWCGLFLARKDILDPNLNGDIDFIAGPLEFNVDSNEWQKRIDAEARRMPLAAARQSVIDQCMMQAAQDGLICWPPRVEYLAACEVKVSWFDGEEGRWHATHMGEGRRVKGQLKILLRYGFNRVAFFHLGATKSRMIDEVNPWLLASHDASASQRTFELLFPPTDMPICGYFQTVVGSVPFATEEKAGAGGRLVVCQPSSPIDGHSQQWRERFLQRLSQLPPPRSCRVYLRDCARCGRWNLLGSAHSIRCDFCGGSLQDDEGVLDANSAARPS